jgi:hypothetical protein
MAAAILLTLGVIWLLRLVWKRANPGARLAAVPGRRERRGGWSRPNWSAAGRWRRRADPALYQEVTKVRMLSIASTAADTEGAS